MTNDLEYAKHISIIHRYQALLDNQSAENQFAALTRTLAIIEDAARQANWRLQELSK